MAITKTETLDKVEIVGDFKALQARYNIIETENDNIVTQSYKRLSFMPGYNIEDLPTELQSYATTEWTEEVIAAYNESLNIPQNK